MEPHCEADPSREETENPPPEPAARRPHCRSSSQAMPSDSFGGKAGASDDSGVGVGRPAFTDGLGGNDHVPETTRLNPPRSVRRACTMDMVNNRIFPEGSNPLGHCAEGQQEPPPRHPLSRLPRRSSMTVKTHRESLEEANAAPLRMAARTRRRRRSSCGGGSVPSLGVDNNAAEEGSADADNLSVGFKSVDIREHPVRCGDNPCCSSGPPLTISWEAEASFSYPVDTFETHRSTDRRQETREMIIPPNERARMLRDEGHSVGEIYQCARYAERDREKMIRTMCQSRTADAIEEKVERTRRAVGNLFRKKKKEDERVRIRKFMEDSKKAEEEQKRALEGEIERDCPAAA